MVLAEGEFLKEHLLKSAGHVGWCCPVCLFVRACVRACLKV